jgi:intergrase/recombinase
LPRKSDSGRVILDQDAKAALDQMYEDLKSQETCISISYSKLVSFIVEQYAKASFAHDRDAIVKRYFNSKEYLKNIIRGVHKSEDVEEALKNALLKVTSSGNPKTQRARKLRKTGENNEPRQPKVATTGNGNQTDPG